MPNPRAPIPLARAPADAPGAGSQRARAMSAGRVLTAALALWLVPAPGLLLADDDQDHDRARAALERGEIQPISRVLEAAAREVPGEVIEVELEREHGRWVYELKVITPRGRVREVLVDAGSARVLHRHDHPEDD